MDIKKIDKVLDGEPKYRLSQARDAIYKNFISDWSEATFFSKNLRDRLNNECPLEIKSNLLISKSGDSVKARITLVDGLQIETVLMRHKDGRNTVCVSSQVGCPLGCLFCATGKMGFKRNLSSDEIIEQVILFERYLKEHGQKVTNVTYMGMGEPFLNYDNVINSIRFLNNKDYFNIGARSISVSTAGIIEGIERLSREGLQVNLAISLHAPNDNLRKNLMPIDKKYPLQDLLNAIDKYIKITNRQVMFEYVLIRDVNDSDKCAEQLSILMKKPLFYVNLILYNQTGSYKPSLTKQVLRFKNILKKNKVIFSQRYRFGDDIKAACGQFAVNKNT